MRAYADVCGRMRYVQALLGLSEPPERIECFDISHDGAGAHTYADVC